MKKLSILALSALFAVSASAQDVFKQAKKIKNAAELQQLIDANSGMPDQEKAQCYDLLVKLYCDKVAQEVAVTAENQMNKSMGKPEVAYDTLGMYKAAYAALQAGILCDKYDQLPNLKGKVAPKFRKSLGERLFPMRGHVLNGGIYYNDRNNHAEVFKYFSLFCDSKDFPMFADIDPAQKQLIDSNVPQIAFYAAAYASQLDMSEDVVNKYCDLAAADPQYAKDAQNVRTQHAAKGLKTHEDSLAYAKKLEAMYEADPSNVQTFQTLAMVQLGLNEAEQFYATCQKRIDAMPNDHIAYYFRGQIRCMVGDFENALPDLEKADELKPGDAGINAFIGQCWVGKATEAENAAADKGGIIPADKLPAIKPIWEKAVSYLKKAKELDVDGSNERNYKSKLNQAEYRLNNDYKDI